jgi:hypothetical protein
MSKRCLYIYVWGPLGVHGHGLETQNLVKFSCFPSHLMTEADSASETSCFYKPKMVDTFHHNIYIINMTLAFRPLEKCLTNMPFKTLEGASAFQSRNTLLRKCDVIVNIFH